MITRDQLLPFCRKLAALPSAELAPRDLCHPCRVRFVGGEGLIMPMRKG